MNKLNCAESVITETNAKLFSYCGLYFEGYGDTAEARKAELEATYPELVKQAKRDVRYKKGHPLVKVAMPCGHTVIYESLYDIPLEDVPCPCGNLNHWIVKWESEK